MALLLFLGCSDMGQPEVLLPQLVIESTAIDFSTITIGSPQTRIIQIINRGEGELNGELTLIQDNTTYVLQPEGVFVILPDDTLIAEITFTPQAELTYSGQVTVTSDDLDNPDITIGLSGVGTALPVPALSLSTSTINFGTILSTSSNQQQLTVSNTGNDTLRIASIDFDLAVYSVDVSAPLELIAGASQVLTLTFQPDGAGSFNGEMSLNSNSPSTPDVVGLSAEAEAPVSYSATVQPVWNASCGGCHGSSGGLSLTSYANLMAGTSSNGPVVVAGDGANSLIVKRLKGEVGGLMPQGGPALSTATITSIETWINQGAHNN